MKFQNTRVFNFENALRGMRNPKESYNKIDSRFGFGNFESDWTYSDAYSEVAKAWVQSKGISKNDYDAFNKSINEVYDWLLDSAVIHADSNSDNFIFAAIGPNDMRLAQALISGGSEHRKFLRQIFITVDITAPLYW